MNSVPGVVQVGVAERYCVFALRSSSGRIYGPDMRLLRRLSVLLVLGVLLTVACSGEGQSSSRRSPAARPAAPATSSAVFADGGCRAQPPDTALPTWARGGFSDPAGPVPHVLGARGNIVAILWARTDALHAPPLASRSNKILWVSKPKFPPGRWAHVFSQLVAPLITEITCLRSHELRLFLLVKAHVGSPPGGTTA